MPSIEELQRFQFEDFALENTRRGKLTVLGEHAFGAEQGRIVTARPSTVDSAATTSETEGRPQEEEPVCAETISVTLSGITFCDECYNGMLVNDDSFNGTYELTLDSSNPCAWSGAGGTIRKRFYEAEDCTGIAAYDEVLPCVISVTLADGQYEVGVFEHTTVSVAMFYALGASTTLDNGEGAGFPSCGDSVLGAKVVATGGTVAIS